MLSLTIDSTVYLAERLSIASRRAEEEDKPVVAFSFTPVPSSNSAMAQICIPAQQTKEAGHTHPTKNTTNKN